MQKLVIQGRLPGLNEYTVACRTNRYAGAKMKQAAEALVKYSIRIQKLGCENEKVWLSFNWYEANMKRDMDNIAFAKKFILDSLTAMGVLKGDGWKFVSGFEDNFYIDKDNPRIEVYISAENLRHNLHMPVLQD